MAKSRQVTIDKRIKEVIDDFKTKRDMYEKAALRLAEDIGEDAPLRNMIHSTKFRCKDVSHLSDKLYRRAERLSNNNKPFDVNIKNYEIKIEDLAGCRLLHIHTKQLLDIHPRILEIIKELQYKLIGKPVSYTWDNENKEFFRSLGISVKAKKSLYTSTHYIIQAHGYPCRCELQVRTLAEELWGEVSHTINYPNEIDSVACKEQLLALARFTSGCTRLVDSLFASKDEYQVDNM